MSDQPVYISNHVREVERIHASVFGDRNWVHQSIRDTLDAHSQSLLSAFNNRDKASGIEISNHFPLLTGCTWEEIVDASLKEEDARLIAARAHSFNNWDAVESLEDMKPDPVFENAVDALVSGRIEELEMLLSNYPGLATTHSAFGHQATLLNYLGSNGVEIRRQKVPGNSVDLARLLIKFGADPRAECQVYGGGFTSLQLAATSAHPADAGIAEELIGYLESISS